MDHLLAKTSGRSSSYFKVLSNQGIFDLPDNLCNSIPYTPNYMLEEDEWFSISSFSATNYCFELLTNEFISAEYNQISVNDYPKIIYLIAYQDGMYYFQKMSSSLVLKKNFFEISQAPSLIKSKKLIIINDMPDAIYDKENDKLYFKRLNSITKIFKGIEEIHKEATHEETKSFLDNNFIKLENEYSAEHVKVMNRKRIALAKETLLQFTLEEKQNIFGYIREYCADLSFDEEVEKFSISNEEDLKKLLYGIEQRYYTTRIGNQKRLANSILTLS